MPTFRVQTRCHEGLEGSFLSLSFLNCPKEISSKQVQTTPIASMAFSLGIALQEVMRLESKSLALTMAADEISEELVERLSYLQIEMELPSEAIAQAMRTVTCMRRVTVDPTMKEIECAVVQSHCGLVSFWTDVYRKALILTSLSDASRVSISLRPAVTERVEIAAFSTTGVYNVSAEGAEFTKFKAKFEDRARRNEHMDVFLTFEGNTDSEWYHIASQIVLFEAMQAGGRLSTHSGNIRFVYMNDNLVRCLADCTSVDAQAVILTGQAGRHGSGSKTSQLGSTPPIAKKELRDCGLLRHSRNIGDDENDFGVGGSDVKTPTTITGTISASSMSNNVNATTIYSSTHSSKPHVERRRHHHIPRPSVQLRRAAGRIQAWVCHSAETIAAGTRTRRIPPFRQR